MESCFTKIKARFNQAMSKDFQINQKLTDCVMANSKDY